MSKRFSQSKSILYNIFNNTLGVQIVSNIKILSSVRQWLRHAVSYTTLHWQVWCMRIFKCQWKLSAVCPAGKKKNTDQNVNLQPSECVCLPCSGDHSATFCTVSKLVWTHYVCAVDSTKSQKGSMELKTRTTGPAETTGGWNAGWTRHLKSTNGQMYDL